MLNILPDSFDINVLTDNAEDRMYDNEIRKGDKMSNSSWKLNPRTS